MMREFLLQLLDVVSKMNMRSTFQPLHLLMKLVFCCYLVSVLCEQAFPGEEGLEHGCDILQDCETVNDFFGDRSPQSSVTPNEKLPKPHAAPAVLVRIGQHPFNQVQTRQDSASLLFAEFSHVLEDQEIILHIEPAQV